MRITEIRVMVATPNQQKFGNPLAFVSVVFEDVFVVHDIKIIRGKEGNLFISLPERAVLDRCSRCCRKNPLRARYCSSCGGILDPDRAYKRDGGEEVFGMVDKGRFYLDIAHPIDRTFRILMQDQVLQAFYLEEQRMAYLEERHDGYND